MIKSAIKRMLYAVAPAATTELLSARSRAHSHRLLRSWGIDRLNRKLLDLLGSSVQSGPFKGMQLTPMTYAEHLGPFLLGTYEAELHPWLNSAAQRQYSQILDIGAKFGYYAVGMALSHPNVETIAFDTDPWARQAMAEMADANRISSLRIEGYCSPAWLDNNLRKNSFILSDCEGFERELFCEATCVALRSAEMVIEMHEMFAPGVTAQIRARFSATHTIESVFASKRELPQMSQLSTLSQDEWVRTTTEFRNEQEWVHLTPK